MAEKFVNEQRIGEVWAAALAKLALKADKTEIADFVKTEGVAAAIAAALTDYAKTEDVSKTVAAALVGYAQSTEVAESIRTALLEYAKSDEVDEAIQEALTNYATTTNVSQAIAKALEDYMDEDEVTAAITDAIGDLANITLQPVESLPQTGEENIIYLVPSTNPKEKNIRDEFIWYNNAWEQIGSTAMDLSGYWSKTDLTPMTSEELSAILNPA